MSIRLRRRRQSKKKRLGKKRGKRKLGEIEGVEKEESGDKGQLVIFDKKPIGVETRKISLEVVIVINTNPKMKSRGTRKSKESLVEKAVEGGKTVVGLEKFQVIPLKVTSCHRTREETLQEEEP